MSTDLSHSSSIWGFVLGGGFVMYPLIVLSIVGWVVILERLWNYRRLGRDLRSFHMEALNAFLHRAHDSSEGVQAVLGNLCARYPEVPTARVMNVALERLAAKDERLRARWREALERRRQLVNQELRQNLWILGTIGSSAPFIGLFGTVVGVLKSFSDIARSGSGGFSVVASGISESLIATAAGIVVAVVALIAYNAFQTRWNGFVLMVKIHSEELADLLGGVPEPVEARETGAKGGV